MTKTGLNKAADTKSSSKRLYVKYMVSLRCKTIVKSELDNLGLDYKFTTHGAIELDEEISDDKHEQLTKSLSQSGLILLNKSESILIDGIIRTIVKIIHYTDTLPKVNFTELINKHALVGEEDILKIFSDVKGMSILQFIVIQKIERAKELMLYEDMPLSEIAELLNYKNKDYLLAQFKKITGLTPSDFKQIKTERSKIAEKHSKTTKESASGM